MSLADYQAAQSRMERELHTRQHQLRLAYDAALGTTIGDDGLVDLSKLEQAAALGAFKTTLNDRLVAGVRGLFGVPEGVAWDEFRVSAALQGAYGVGQGQLDNIADQLQAAYTFDNFAEHVIKAGLERVVAPQLAGIVLGKLTEHDRHDVLHHVGVSEGSVYEQLLTPEQMAKLLGQYEQHGVVPQNWLKRQPFYNAHGGHGHDAHGHGAGHGNDHGGH